MLKKPPRVRDNNGALQVRLRLGGRDHFINRIGRFDDPVAQARGQAICAEIWRDAQQGDLDLSLNRYRPLVEGRDQDLLNALRSLAEEKRQARVTHAYRVVMRFGLPIRTKAEVDRFLAWMKAELMLLERELLTCTHIFLRKLCFQNCFGDELISQIVELVYISL